MMHTNHKQGFKSWREGEVGGLDGWNAKTRRGTVLLAKGDTGEVHAHVLGDSGLLASFSVQQERVPAFLASVATQWQKVGATGSFGVLINGMGTAPIPTPPIPVPGPIGDEFLTAGVRRAHDELAAMTELAMRPRG